MRYVTIANVKQGMIFGRKIYDDKGFVLANTGVTVSYLALKRLIADGIQGIYIKDRVFDDIEINDVIDKTLRIRAIQSLAKKDYDAAINYAKQISDILYNQSTTDIDLLDLKRESNYTEQHAVSVCIYSAILGIEAKMRAEEVENLAVAAMLADIGKDEIPLSILKKKEELTAEEWAEIHQHPKTAFEKLKDVYAIPSVVRNAILFSHENVDGTGYYGRAEKDITDYAKIIRICDTYDAMTSKRPYRDAYAPAEAIEYILANTNSIYDSDYVRLFATKFPMYPIGFSIRLSNGEIAVVCSNTRNSMRPVIKLTSGKKIDLFDNEEYRGVTILGIV